MSLHDALEQLTRDGYALGVEEALDRLDDEAEAPPDGGKKGSRLTNLLHKVPTAIVVGYVATRLTRALVNNTDPTAAVQRVYDGLDEWGTTQASALLTDPITQGRAATYESNKITRVTLTLSGDGCEFCSGYDGRTMSIDHDEGFPPLHNACECGIDPAE